MNRDDGGAGTARMTEAAIRDRLVEHGCRAFEAPATTTEFTGNPEADALIIDLDQHPHAFVLACLMSRGVKAEKAWLIPYLISQQLGNFAIDSLGNLSIGDIEKLMSGPPSLHRYHGKMAEAFHSGVQRISSRYGGDASGIWQGNLPSAEVVFRFLEFRGAGPKIATMAVNILASYFKIPFQELSSIDVSADTHVRQVFGRLGLCAPDASVEEVIFKARALYPRFPGVMDLPCWEIGRDWCKPRNPQCAQCYMDDLYPKRSL